MASQLTAETISGLITLNRDVSKLIFDLLDKKTILTLRLVCKSFNDQFKSRLTVFRANLFLKVVPLMCEILICQGKELPQMHDNLVKAIIYDSDCNWKHDIDTVFIYTSVEFTSPRIQCSVNNLILGVFTREIVLAKNLNFTLDTFLSESNYIYYSTYCNLYLTSRYPCLSSPGVRVIYLLPGTVIKRLLVGAYHLHLIDLDVTVDEFYVLNSNNRSINVFTYKSKFGEHYEYSGHLVKLDQSIWK